VADEAVTYRFSATGQASVDAAFESSARAAEKAAQREIRARERADQVASRSRARMMTGDAQRDAARAKIIERASIASVRAETRERERGLRHVAGIRDRHFREQQRQEERNIRLQARASERIAKDRMRTLSKVGDRVGGFASSAATMGVLGVAALTGAAARQAMKTRETAERIAINASAAGAGRVDAGALGKTFQNVALATPGISSADVGSAAQMYQSRIGKVMDQEQLQVLATAASASGANIVDLADAMSALTRHLDIKTIDQFKDSLSAMISQGARGSFELKDAAANYAEMASAAGMFGLKKGTGGVRTLGGLTQIAMGATGSASESSTAIKNLFLKLGTEGESIKSKYGVDVYDKGGKARDVTEILFDVIAKAGGKDVGKKNAELTKLFDIRALGAIKPIIAAFNDAIANGTDGMAAMRAVVEEAAGESGNWTDRQREASAAQEMASAQLSSAWERVLQVVDAQVVPALIPLAEQLPELVAAVTPLIGIFGDLASIIVDFAKLIPGVDSSSIERRQARSAAQRELRALEAGTPGSVGTPTLEDLDRADALRYQIQAYDEISKEPGAAKGALEKRLSKVTTGTMAVGAAVGGAYGGKGGALIGGGVGYFAGASAAAEQLALERAGVGPTGMQEGLEAGMAIPRAEETYSGRQAAAARGAENPKIDTKDAQASLDAVAKQAAIVAAKFAEINAPTAGNP
jgi:hypothetical protein